MNDDQANINQKPLIEVDEAEVFPLRVREMWILHGKSAGQHCKDCAHLIHTGRHNTVFLKCSKSKITASKATDWRAGWTACGLFEIDGVK